MLEILAGVLGFVVIGSLGWVLVGGDDSSQAAVKRAQGFGAPKDQNAVRKAQANTPEARRKQILDQLQESEKAERKARLSLSARLKQAGLSTSVKTFWIVSGVLGVLGLLLPMLFGVPLLVCLGLALILGLGMPRWWLGMMGKRRRKKFSDAFADAVDVIVRGIKSGLPVHDCFKIIARESPAPLGPEFQTLVEGLSVGLTLGQALERMYERMPTPELKFFAIVISIQQKTGGNLAEALSNLSTVLRSRKLMAEKIKALSSEATASAGIIGSLPPAVMVLVGITTPAYIAVLFTDTRGQFMLLIAVTMMSFGVFVMKKMIAFKF